VYWLEIYALIAAVVFAMADLFILMGLVWFELTNPPIGTPVALIERVSRGR